MNRTKKLRYLAIAFIALGAIMAAVLVLLFLMDKSGAFSLKRVATGHIAWAASMMISCLVFGGFFKIFSKTVTEHCTFRTTVMAFAISLMGGTGLYAFLGWGVLAVFGEIRRYPIEHMAYVSVGAVCFFIFLGLVAAYPFVRSVKPTLRGWLIDISTAILFVAPVFRTCGMIASMLDGMFTPGL